MAKDGGKKAAAKRLTKAQIVAEIAEKSELSKKDVGAVFEQLKELVKRELGKKGPGEFVIPDLLKLKVKVIPARPAEKKMNHFTKKEQLFPARPASKKVRATPLKKLKDLVA